jgi:hypothetical protein
MPGSYGVSTPKQLPGRPISARTINAGVGLAERLARMRAGNGLKQSAVDGIPIFELDATFALIARSPSGGIPAISAITADEATPGSADCEVWIFDGTKLLRSGASETIWNMSDAVDGDKFIQAKRAYGALWVDVESCT